MDELTCGCGARYPVVLGIPDLRVCADPYIDPEPDRAKARALATAGAGGDLEALLRFYWSITPGTPAEAAARYVAYALRAEARARSVLDDGGEPSAPGVPRGALLDLGTGTGGLLVAASGSHETLVGVDIALRWLVIARHRLEECGVTAQLVCACADHLPFRERTFDRVAGVDLLPHAAHPAATLAEAARVMRSAGNAIFTSENRLSLLPDPHTRLLAAGFLPGRARADYIRWRTGTFNANVSPPTTRQAKRWAKRAFARVATGLPGFSPEEIAVLAERERRLAAAWNRLRRAPFPLSALLETFGPVFTLRCRSPRESVT